MIRRDMLRLWAAPAGAPADISLLAIEEGRFQLVDSRKNAVTAARRVVSRLTVARGRRLVARL